MCVHDYVIIFAYVQLFLVLATGNTYNGESCFDKHHQSSIGTGTHQSRAKAAVSQSRIHRRTDSGPGVTKVNGWKTMVSIHQERPNDLL